MANRTAHAPPCGHLEISWVWRLILWARRRPSESEAGNLHAKLLDIGVIRPERALRVDHLASNGGLAGRFRCLQYGHAIWVIQVDQVRPGLGRQCLARHYRDKVPHHGMPLIPVGTGTWMELPALHTGHRCEASSTLVCNDCRVGQFWIIMMNIACQRRLTDVYGYQAYPFQTFR
jgi:hypothetical protein